MCDVHAYLLFFQGDLSKYENNLKKKVKKLSCTSVCKRYKETREKEEEAVNHHECFRSHHLSVSVVWKRRMLKT